MAQLAAICYGPGARLWPRLVFSVVVVLAACFTTVEGFLSGSEVQQVCGDTLLSDLRKTPMGVSVFDNATLSMAQRTLRAYLSKKLEAILPLVESGDYYYFTEDEWSAYILPRLTEDCFFVQPGDTYRWQELVGRTAGRLSMVERDSLLENLAATVLDKLKENKFDLKEFENEGTPEDALSLFYSRLQPFVEKGRETWKRSDLDQVSVKQCLVELKHLLPGPDIFKHTGTKSADAIFGRFAEKSWKKVVPGTAGTDSPAERVDILSLLEELQREVRARLRDEKIDFNDFVHYQSPLAAYFALQNRVRVLVDQVREKWTPAARARISEISCVQTVLLGIDPNNAFVNSSSRAASEIFGRHADPQWNQVEPRSKGSSGMGECRGPDLFIVALLALIGGTRALAVGE
ncbi:hypothetical protein CSUI_010227 [Cystoisospora suis]|uniref:Transmembrane protein n=1 Tax=Cystoisospora suis TaxID=483139 RepID=A0A2C6JCM5_9APIC|nr:hypothetical protein CSUI_010227 [Cystoisospora suis]